jgi:predicted aspartyl protease
MPSLAFQYNPSVGPLIQLAIWPAGFNPNQQPAGLINSPVSVTFYNALIDTGASCTCITPKVVTDVGLTPVGKQSVGGVHGKKIVNQYQFQVALVFPQSQAATGLVNANAMAISVTGVEFDSPGGFDVLLGRDIICRGLFHLSFDGHGTLSL